MLRCPADQALGLRPWLAALLLRLWRLRDRLLIEGSSLRRAVVRVLQPMTVKAE